MHDACARLDHPADCVLTGNFRSKRTEDECQLLRCRQCKAYREAFFRWRCGTLDPGIRSTVMVLTRAQTQFRCDAQPTVTCTVTSCIYSDFAVIVTTCNCRGHIPCEPLLDMQQAGSFRPSLLRLPHPGRNVSSHFHLPQFTSNV